MSVVCAAGKATELRAPGDAPLVPVKTLSASDFLFFFLSLFLVFPFFLTFILVYVPSNTSSLCFAQ